MANSCGLIQQAEERRKLQQRFKDLKKKFQAPEENGQMFETKVRTGNGLAGMAAGVKGLEKREVYHRIPQYLYGNVRTSCTRQDTDIFF